MAEIMGAELQRQPRLKGKVAIVTGAGSRGDIIGNGQAAAILFAYEGADVLLVDTSEEHVGRTLDAIRVTRRERVGLHRRRDVAGELPGDGRGGGAEVRPARHPSQ